VLTGSEAAALITQARAGDAAALTALARALLRPVYLIALSIVGRPADAEDVAQETLLRALTRLEQCRQPESFVAWSLAIAKNRALNHLAARRLREPRGEPGEGPDKPDLSHQSHPELALVRRDLLRALDSLSPVQRQVVLLHDLEGWSHQEIGESLGISQVNSRQHLFIARRAVRAALQSKRSA
jgi:RNA polymerase sigma-70 factor (ECF subfamily)